MPSLDQLRKQRDAAITAMLEHAGFANSLRRQIAEAEIATARLILDGWGDRPIRDLELDTRAHNSLTEAGINTIGTLLAHTRHDLALVGGVGNVSLNHICERLAQVGLNLRED